MASIILAENDVRIPAGFANHAAYRRWARSNDYPRQGWFSYLAGDLFVDLSLEEFLTHNLVKGEFAIVLGSIVKRARMGYWAHDRMLLSHPGAGLSTEPDGLFASFTTVKARRLLMLPGVDGGCVEFEGTPDMVLEVVSDSSIEKDTVILPGLYAAAGIAEYWLVDVRGSEIQFDIMRLAERGYVKTRRTAGGWLKSRVFQRSFRLVANNDPLDNRTFSLEVRE